MLPKELECTGIQRAKLDHSVCQHLNINCFKKVGKKKGKKKKKEPNRNDSMSVA